MKILARRPNREIIRHPLTKKEFLLPKGMRISDVKHLDNEEADILLDLASYGRRTRYYYKKHGMFDLVKRLKFRGFIEAVCVGNGNYAYDITEGGRVLMQNGFI